ncbi:MAG TPA: RQC domain-containing protein, partial [Limnochordia bacterium]|nr:RQC domain-containing protein [Limnochordia bacterium]
MARQSRVRVQLTPVDEMIKPNDDELRCILRAADEIIMRAGRDMVAKILKGSRDKKVLEHGLDACPVYGCFS